jgi:ABC-type phosphate transport system permease subunit
MATSRERNRFTGFAAALTAVVAVLACALICALVWIDAAAASQDPGVAAGTASTLTQAMVAILVYGASALVVGSGLIGALRQQ